MTEVTVYVRPGCHLCEDALEVVERVRAAHVFNVCIVDIETSEELHMRYVERIPVITVNRVHLSDFRVDEAALVRAVANLGRPAGRPTT